MGMDLRECPPRRSMGAAGGASSVSARGVLVCGTYSIGQVRIARPRPARPRLAGHGLTVAERRALWRVGGRACGCSPLDLLKLCGNADIMRRLEGECLIRWRPSKGVWMLTDLGTTTLNLLIHEKVSRTQHLRLYTMSTKYRS